TNHGGVDVGQLEIRRVQNGFSIGWQSREMDLASALGRRLSTSDNPAALLAQHPDVRAALQLPDDGGYLVHLDGSDRWLKVVPERKSTADIGAEFHARFADTSVGAHG